MKKLLIALLTVALAAMPAGATGYGGPLTGLHNWSGHFYQEYEEFSGTAWTCAAGSTEEHSPWTVSVAAGGGGSVTALDDPGGVIRLSSGTANLSNSRVAIGSWDSTPSVVRNFSCDLKAQAVFHISAVNLSSNGWIGTGFTYDNIHTAVYSAQAIGAVFIANSGVNSGRWTAAWGDGSSGSTWDSGVSASGDVWLKIALWSNSRVDFSVSTTPSFTSGHVVTTNIPDSGEDLVLAASAINIGGNIGSTTMDLDAIFVAQEKP